MAKKRGRRRGLYGFVQPAKQEGALIAYGGGTLAGFGAAAAADKFAPAAVPGWLVKALPFLAGGGAWVMGWRKLGLGLVGGGAAYVAVGSTVMGLLSPGAGAGAGAGEGAGADEGGEAPGPGAGGQPAGYLVEGAANAQIGAYLANAMRGDSTVGPGVRINGVGTYGNPGPRLELVSYFNGPFGQTFAPRM